MRILCMDFTTRVLGEGLTTDQLKSAMKTHTTLYLEKLLLLFILQDFILTNSFIFSIDLDTADITCEKYKFLKQNWPPRRIIYVFFWLFYLFVFSSSSPVCVRADCVNWDDWCPRNWHEIVFKTRNQPQDLIFFFNTIFNTNANEMQFQMHILDCIN